MGIQEVLTIIFVGVGIASVPIVVKMAYDFIKANVDEKTLFVLDQLVQAAVEAAEQIFENGEEKRAFVIKAVTETAKMLNLRLSDEAIQKLVDMLLEASVYRTFNSGPAMLFGGDEGGMELT